MPREPKNIEQKSKLVTGIITTEVPQFVEEEKDIRKLRAYDYIPFGTNNLYPQALATLYRKSITLRNIVQSKATFLVSGGFQVEDGNKDAEELITRINNKGQTANDLYYNYSIDRGFSGNSYLEVITDKDRTFVKIEHVQTVKCRKVKGKEQIIIHPDWERRKPNVKAGADPLDKVLPLFPEFEEIDGNYRSILHKVDYEPDFDHYGIPGFIAAMDAAAIGYKTNKWNVSRLDNSFQSSGVLVVDGDMDEDDAVKLKDEFKKEMVGEDNQGKILMIIKKMGGEGTEFTSINNNVEGDWIKLHNQSNDDLILSMNWKKSLSGITEATGFDTDRILNDYQVAKSTFIIKEQNDFIKVLQSIIDETIGIDLSGLTINNVPPVSLLTKLTADRFVRIWEARKEAGLEFDSEDESQMGYVESEEVANNEAPEATARKLINKIKDKLKL